MNHNAPQEINNINDFATYISNNPVSDGTFTFKNLIFNCDLTDGTIFYQQVAQGFNRDNTLNVKFESCKFNRKFLLEHSYSHYQFIICEFYEFDIDDWKQTDPTKKVKASTNIQTLFFAKCKFHCDFKLSNKLIKEHVTFVVTTFFHEARITNNQFKEDVKINNCRFLNDFLLDDNTFHKDVYLEAITIKRTINYYKNTFKGVTTLIDPVFPESTNFLSEYKLEVINSAAKTFCLFKDIALKKNNFVLGSDLYKLEHEYRLLIEDSGQIRKNLRNSDYIILWLNKWSNNFKTSWIRGVGFTLVANTLFFILVMICSKYWYLSFRWSDINETLYNWFTSLNPIHKPTDLKVNGFNAFSYLFDALGRIFVGYGIYQTVQAFRKYR